MLETVNGEWDEQEVRDLRELRYEFFTGASSSRRSQAPPLPPGLMQHLLLSPVTPMDSPSELLGQGPRPGNNRDARDDVDMTQ